jgi:radical SAM protein with 4Fe4S-binding SPASM domain
VKALRDGGVQDIELDLEGAYTHQPGLDLEAMQQGMADTATYYAERLLKNDYFRIEPIATLFLRIYHGIPSRRTDPAGVQALAVDGDGDVWPSMNFAGNHASRLGNVLTGVIDEDRIQPFGDVGVMGTPACMRCWARHLCGGGFAAIHHALSGSFRVPHEPWCDAQRAWTTAAVSAFNLLSTRGVHFTRIYQSLNRKGRPSFFQMARTALKMSVIMRPLAEADAPMLREWQDWNAASYFLLHPAGALLTTKYEREMDALYPFGAMQEMLLTTRRGDPLGLVKMRPDKWPGVHLAWLYLRREPDYAAPSIRSGFKELVKQAALAQDIRRVVFHAAAYEPALAEFLAACGFHHEGTHREGLYAHAAYHDVHIYAATVSEL